MERVLTEAESWRDEETSLSSEVMLGAFSRFDAANTDARERSRLLQLLGRSTTRSWKGNRVYVEVVA